MQADFCALPLVICLLAIAVIVVLNLKYGFVTIPSDEDFASRQIDYITISTVFIGFSFTALGLILGVTNYELIKNINGTTIIRRMSRRIMNSIVFFIIVVGVALFLVIVDIEASCLKDVLFVVQTGFLVLAIIYFVFSVHKLYNIVKKIYFFEENKANKDIERVRNSLNESADAPTLQDNVDDLIQH